MKEIGGVRDERRHTIWIKKGPPSEDVGDHINPVIDDFPGRVWVI